MWKSEIVKFHLVVRWHKSLRTSALECQNLRYKTSLPFKSDLVWVDLVVE